ncbi:MAG TPA: isoprenylcysteine carboxylmethyltransferase family protein [Pyrinomonadaceae bacterium]
MLIPIIATVVRVIWIAIEYPYLRRYHEKPSRDLDRHSARLWDAANLIEPIGVFLGFAGVGAMPASAALIQPAGIALLVIGIAIRWASIRTLGKYFTGTIVIRDDHQLIRTGLYRFLRHPAYSGALLAHLGLGISFANWFSLGLSTFPFVVAACYRMRVEDRALYETFGEEYLNYSMATKRLIPKVY